MSLRAIHVMVIIFSIALLFFFGIWAFSAFQAQAGRPYFYWGIASVSAGILLVPYLVWFIMKMRRPSN